MRDLFFKTGWLRASLAFLFFLICHCGGIGSATSAAETSSSIESLGETETQLFDEGPLEMPVTIAKLESPNPIYIDITPADSVPDADSSLFLDADSVTMIVLEGEGSSVAAARAIRDPIKTPYVYIYNQVTREGTVAEVGSDGSFSAVIAATIDQGIGVYAMTTSLPATAVSSPGVIFILDEYGTVTVTISNSNSINERMALVVDATGNILFSVSHDNGLFDLWQRNVDGTLPELLLENHAASMLMVAPLGGDTTEEYAIVDDVVNLLYLSSGTASPIAEDLGTIEQDEDNVFMAKFVVTPLTQNSVLVKRPSPNGLTQRLEAYTLAGERAIVIGDLVNGVETDYTDMRFSYGGSTDLTFVAVRSSAHKSSLYRVDLDRPFSELEMAWGERVPLFEDAEFEILTLTAKSDGSVYLMVADPATVSIKILSVDAQGQIVTLADTAGTDLSLYAQLTVQPEGEILLACDVGVDHGVSEQRLLALPLDGSTDGEFVPFLANGQLRSCNHFAFDAAGRIHFFTAASSDSPPQLSFIDSAKNPILAPYMVLP